MIVIVEGGPSRSAAVPAGAGHCDPLPQGARSAQQAAEAVLAGALTLEQASARYRLAVPLLETWLRALLSSGLIRSGRRG